MAQFMVDAFNTVSCKFFERRFKNGWAMLWQDGDRFLSIHSEVEERVMPWWQQLWAVPEMASDSQGVGRGVPLHSCHPWAFEQGGELDVEAVYERVSCHILSRHFGGGLRGGVDEHRRVALLPGAWRQVEGTVAIPSQAYGYYRGYDWGASGERGEETPLSGGITKNTDALKD